MSEIHFADDDPSNEAEPFDAASLASDVPADESLAVEADLRAELEASQATLEDLACELRGVDRQLEELEDERQQIELVQSACASLEKLRGLGGDDLFWGDLQPSGAERIDAARSRIDGRERHYAEIEWTRKPLLERIAQEEARAFDIEDALDELLREREERAQEWIVEREMSPDADRAPHMPWSGGAEDDVRLRKSLATSLALALLLAAIIPMIDLPVPERWEVIEVPDRFARLIEPAPEPEPVTKPRAVAEEVVPEQPAEAPQQVAEEKVPEPTPQAAVEKAPEPARGILAFREKFSGLADARPSPKLGARARVHDDGQAAVGRRGRSLIATRATGQSGGIDMSDVSRDAVGGGGQGLEGVAVARVESAIGGLAGSDRPLAGGGPAAGRTDEEIQIVFDRHKAALYRLYNRALRQNPTLQGQIVLRLTIEADGSVSLCEVHASDLDAPDLAARVVGRVKNFDFGAKEGIPAVTLLYPIDFLPAT